ARVFPRGPPRRVWSSRRTREDGSTSRSSGHCEGKETMRMPVRPVLCGLWLVAATAAAFAADAPQAPAAAPPPAAVAAAAPAAAPAGYAPLDIPEWAVKESESAAKDQPWILIVDDPQCPYCMQLSLGIEKARENNDAEVVRAAVVHVFYPLA